MKQEKLKCAQCQEEIETTVYPDGWFILTHETNNKNLHYQYGYYNKETKTTNIENWKEYKKAQT